jgi:hypothetical protein
MLYNTRMVGLSSRLGFPTVLEARTFNSEEMARILSSLNEALEIRTLGELEKIVYEYIPQHLVGSEQRQFMQAVLGARS